MIRHIEDQCNCRPALFPPFMPVNESEDYELHFETEEFYEICKFSEVSIAYLCRISYAPWRFFFQHVRCAAPLYRNFTYENCNCDPGLIQYRKRLIFIVFVTWYEIGKGCLSVTFEVEHIMYGKWREAQYARSYLGKSHHMIMILRLAVRFLVETFHWQPTKLNLN